jgi:hypothetical protein
MKRLMILLRVPLVIELINVIAHRLLRPPSQAAHWSQDTHWIDDVSMLITAVVMLVTGWIVARAFNRVAVAVLGALFVWLVSVLTVVAFMGATFYLQPKTSRDVELLAIQGFLFSGALLIPVVAVLAAISGFFALRVKRSS